MTPATPEAVSVCPMLSLTDPRKIGRQSPRSLNVDRTLPYSMGSPMRVPGDQLEMEKDGRGGATGLAFSNSIREVPLTCSVCFDVCHLTRINPSRIKSGSV
jgi:hypothetical protein